MERKKTTKRYKIKKNPEIIQYKYFLTILVCEMKLIGSYRINNNKEPPAKKKKPITITPAVQLTHVTEKK